MQRDGQRRGVFAELGAFAWRHRLLVGIPIVLALLLLVLLLLTGENASPFLYTLF